MKKTIIFIIVAAMSALAMTSLVSAQSNPAGSGWWVGFTAQNAGTATGIVESKIFYTSGDVNASTNANGEFNGNANVKNGNAITFHPGLAGTCAASATVAVNGCRIGLGTLPAGFQGSAVLSSNSPLVAYAQVNNNNSGSVGTPDGKARSAYQGTSNNIADTTLYFPNVKVNFANQSTVLYVQAAGDDATGTVDFTMQNGATVSRQLNVTANRMQAFLLTNSDVSASCTGGANLGCIGSAIVTSNTPVAGTVVEFRNGVSVASYVLSTRAMTPADISSKIIAPVMKSDFNGSTTGASILNTSDTQAVVNLTFSVTGASAGCANNAGNTATSQVTIPAKSSTVVSKNRNNIGGLAACTFFAMTAEAQGGQQLAITVNESQANGTRKAVYSGFNTSNATGDVLFPLVKENFNRNTTAVTLVNAGSTATTAKVTYVGSSSTHVVETQSIAPGQAINLRVNRHNSSISDYAPQSGSSYPATNDKYAVAVESTGSIVGLAQEATYNQSSKLDIYNYEGFNQ